MSHASMLKARRKHQKIRKQLDGEAKRAKHAAALALRGPVVKKEKVKKEKVKSDVDKPKKVKKDEPAQQQSKKAKGDGGKQGAS